MSKEERSSVLGKIYLVFTGLVRVSLIVALIFALINSNWMVAGVSLLTLVLTFLPNIFEKTYNIDIPIELEVATVAFVYATLFLGEVESYYYKFWWWDLLLHSFSAIAFGFIGFLILYTLYARSKFAAKPITIAFFSFCFVMAIGSLWEIFEFTMDQIFGFNMQKSGLLDTMYDIIITAMGAVISSVIGFVYLKTGRTHFVHRIIRRFARDNPHLFRN